MKTATLANGCFWCTEAVFQKLKGIEKVTSGYSEKAESIQIKFDENIISFEEILLIFFKTHDPTTLNRQGNDVGPQYRSAIFYHDDNQKQDALNMIKKLESEKIFSNKIITEVTKFKSFFETEDYHKNYYNNNKNAGYCKVVIDPKLVKLEKEFGDKLK